jgi:hypothetical protein
VSVLDFDGAESWIPMKRDDLAGSRAACPACHANIGESNGVPANAAGGEPGAFMICPHCDFQWLAMLDRH